ncbi:MAG: EF-hand domain-containing protein [Alphaproteobacteria bacterium]|nr:EF-hand domain-containing protein [Alphaproteobacteria bacterium]
MSIGGIGSHSGHDLSKVLSALLARLDTSESDATAPPSGTAGATGAATCNKAWQRGEARLSSDILTVLLRLQQQEDRNAQNQPTDDAATPDTSTEAAAPADPATTDATATDASAAPSDSPVHRLFAAIDANQDGDITKEEFETFIKAKGGTQEEADKLYALLDKDGDGKLSEDQLAEAIRRGHHGHHYGWLARPNAERLFAKIDGDGDGKLTKDEMEKFVTDRGGKAERADKFFAKADRDGDGAVDQAELAQAIRPHAHHTHGSRGGKDDGDGA